MTNSANPDQLASSEANWSGSTLFAKAEPIQVQQDQGQYSIYLYLIVFLHFVSICQFNPCPAEPGYTLPLQTV